jgi:hypothetical protein
MTKTLSTRWHTALATVALVAAAGIALSGCTGGTPSPDATGTTDGGLLPEGQSVEQACEIISDEVQTAVAGFEDTAQDDPAVAVEAMKRAAEALGEASGRVTNNEVSALLPRMQTMFGELGDVVQSVLVDGDVSQAEGLQTLAGDFQQVLGQFQELCSPE